MAAEHDEAVATPRRKKKTVRSEVRGVHLLQHGKYRARIWDPSRRATRHLGVFSTAEEAARAYNAAAVQLHGAPTALTHFRQHTADGCDAPRLDITCVDKAAKADGDGDAPLLQISCADKDAAGESSRPGQDAAESVNKRMVPRSDARAVLRRVRRKPSGKYMAKIIKSPKVGARRFLGGFNTAKDAARAYVASAVKLHGGIGLKKAHVVGDQVDCKSQAGREAEAAASKSNSTPGFHGVRQAGSRKKYSARIWDPAKRAKVFIGTFDTAEEAARAFDAEAVRLRGAKAITNLKQQPTVRKKTAAGAGFRGVRRKPRGKYAAQIRKGKEKSGWLGLFDSAEDAARAYDAAAVKLHGRKAIANFKQPPMAAAAADAAEESPMDLDDFPELHGVSAITNFKQPPTAAATVDGVESPMDLTDTDFPEKPPLDVFSGTITADAQLDESRSAQDAGNAAAIKLQGVAAISKRVDVGLKKPRVAEKAGNKERKKEAAAVKSKSKSGFLGVSRGGNRYSARIYDKGLGTKINLCTVDTAEEAARVYDTVAVRMRGVNTKTNFKQLPMIAAANELPKLHGMSAKTDFKQPLMAAATDDIEESPMDVTDNDFLELPALDFCSGTITVHEQLEDVFADLAPLDFEQMDEFLNY